MSRINIVATIGPATANKESLLQLRTAGMSVVRLNGSHADLAWHEKTIRLVHEILPEIPILLDIPGRKIRTAQLAHHPSFKKGQTLVLTTDTSHDGSVKVPVNFPSLHEFLSPGLEILADDGTLSFTVVRVEGRDIICRANVDGILRSRKGINIPKVPLGDQLITPRDREMVEFARANAIDFIGVSFVESAAHVDAIRTLTPNGWPRIVAKVENQRGLENVIEIAAVADAIMIDRGDLSVETTLENMAVLQKQILKTANAAGRPVIVATEMLHTMINNPFPTKAEVSDITNAVLDGCAATMLSGETAIGDFPVEAVSIMRRIADVASSHRQSELDDSSTRSNVTVPQAIEDAIALICRNLAVTKIVAVTISGYAARMIAARQPRQPILAVSNDARAARSFNLLPGTEGIFFDIPFSRSSTDHIVACMEELWRRGKISDRDLVLVTAVGYPQSGNRMNLIQTHHVRDLIDALGWQRSVQSSSAE